MAQIHTIAPPVGCIFETTDATASTAVTYQTSDDEAYLVVARVVAVDTTDFSQIAGYVRAASFKNDGGTLAQVGSTTGVATHESDSNWDCDLDASGTTIRVRVTGEAAKTITWRVALEVLPCGKPSTPQTWA